jgi:prepilin-type N-terminal cleavage/methylation domain-containing protein/prepilin-type processing-associated H-X9-DG protein
VTIRDRNRPAPWRGVTDATQQPVFQSGFTLIELLVVVAILALLVAMLMPSLHSAKELARRAVCASNIRQVLIATKGYATEHHGYYVPAAADMWGANLHRWHGVREHINEAFDPRLGPLRAYLFDGQVKHCPSFTDDIEAAGQRDAFEAGCGGYGYNGVYVGARFDLIYDKTALQQTARESEIRNPAETVIFTDAATRRKTGMIAYSFCEPVFWQFGPGEPSSSHPNPTIHFRHLDTTSVAWADGHVDFRTLDFSKDYKTHARITAEEAAAIGLGWFGPVSNDLFDLK